MKKILLTLSLVPVLAIAAGKETKKTSLTSWVQEGQPLWSVRQELEATEHDSAYTGLPENDGLLQRFKIGRKRNAFESCREQHWQGKNLSSAPKQAQDQAFSMCRAVAEMYITAGKLPAFYNVISEPDWTRQYRQAVVNLSYKNAIKALQDENVRSAMGFAIWAKNKLTK